MTKGDGQSTLLWDKSGVAPDAEMMIFLAGQDVELDRSLMHYDIKATAAHVAGLQRIGILNEQERESVTECLNSLLVKCEDGSYLLAPPFEDSHSAIEAYVTQELGDIGKKIHTGRSRNDQVLVATRLYMLDQLSALSDMCLELAGAFLARARLDEMTPMPGYTHLQRAVPSSVGLWMAAYAEAFINNTEYVRSVRQHVDQCPLGTAAGYGVNLPLDRDGVSQELGFSRLQLNPMYAQNSRGKFELLALQALGQVTLDVRRLAWDLSLFCCEEFGFIGLPPDLCTGSSIMPNKSNPDLVELLRALHSEVMAAQIELDSVMSLPSGYHRDLQATKGAFLRPWPRALMGLRLLKKLIEAMELKSERMMNRITAPMLSTDKAIQRVLDQGASFREAYRGNNSGPQEENIADQVVQSLNDRVSTGACGQLLLDSLSIKIQSLTE